MVGATTAGRDRICKPIGSDRGELTLGRAVETERKTYPALHVLLSTPEAALKQRVEDAAETKRRLDDVRCKLAD